MSEGVIIALSSSIPPTIVAVLALFMSTALTKRQLKISVVSNNRQAWINDLRSTIAEFTSTSKTAAIEMIALTVPTKNPIEQNKQIAEFLKSDRFVRVHFLADKIRLLLNPNEEDHKNLVSLIDNLDVLRVRAAEESSRQAMEKTYAIIIQISQKILKREWERVKRGD